MCAYSKISKSSLGLYLIFLGKYKSSIPLSSQIISEKHLYFKLLSLNISSVVILKSL